MVDVVLRFVDLRRRRQRRYNGTALPRHLSAA